QDGVPSNGFDELQGRGRDESYYVHLRQPHHRHPPGAYGNTEGSQRRELHPAAAPSAAPLTAVRWTRPSQESQATAAGTRGSAIPSVPTESYASKAAATGAAVPPPA